MIIGETFNNEYDRYEEDSYDYLFKRKSKEERQQKKAERKEKRTEKKQLRQEKKLAKQDPTTGGKKKLQLFGNFGLFDKNKNKNKTAGSTTSPGSSAKTGPGASSEPSSSEESKTTPESKSAAADAAASASQENSESGAESAKLEMKELDKDGNPKKEAGFGPLLGFTFLGITILLAGYAIFKADKKPISELQPLRAAA